MRKNPRPQEEARGEQIKDITECRQHPHFVHMISLILFLEGFRSLHPKGRSPDLRVHDLPGLPIPLVAEQWRCRWAHPRLTVAGPCRLCTGFPINPCAACGAKGPLG